MAFYQAQRAVSASTYAHTDELGRVTAMCSAKTSEVERLRVELRAERHTIMHSAITI